MCVSCNRPIRDRYVMHVTPDLNWHDTCLSCSECGKRLDEKFTCFVRGGKTYCKEDFFRLVGIRCFKCRQPFGASDLVLDGERYEGIFHNECFTCSLCNKRYNNISPTTTCTTHNHKLSPSSSSPSLLSTSCSATNSTSATGQHKSSQHSRNKHGDGVNISSGSSSVNKTTRVRTVLNEKQLHTLRTCYAANPRPDALMKDQLVEMTGLNSRVIRVWFQNKRCKDKKRTILIKQIQQHNQEKVRLRWNVFKILSCTFCRLKNDF
uniref:Uncharacterized protein n=1 Tax=Helobdella robusta TaxID=6412 RepID=T1FXS5_HELRO